MSKKVDMVKFRKVEELVRKHFPNALYNRDNKTFYASVNSRSWDEPKELINLNQDWSDADARAQINGSSWDDQGDIEINIK